MATVLTANGLGFRYPGAQQPTISGLDLEIEAGEFVAIVGGSGVGKSTLLRAIAGLVPCDDGGTLQLRTKARPGCRRRAIVFQDSRLLPWRNLAANIAYGLEGLKLGKPERNARVGEMLELTRLTEFADRYPHQLSGGQAQRGGIARALAVRPDMLLMDEPFSAVDALTRARLQDELIRIWQHSGAAVLFVTHDIGEAVHLADRVVVLAGQPARLALDLRIDLPRPRQRDATEAAAYVQRIAAAL